MAPARTIAIIGAGISGLTLALALAKFGLRVLVLERQPAVQEYGAGLQIGPNARKVLDHLGLEEAVSANSFEPAGIDVFPLKASRPLVTLVLGETIRARFGAPYAVMHRADLAQVLLRACKRFANVEMLFGAEAFEATPSGENVALAFDDADGRRRQTRVFALIGADGLNSDVRTRLLGGAPARFDGSTAWRALLPRDALAGLVAKDRTTLLLGPGCHAVLYPLPHRDRLNVALFTTAPASGSAEAPTLPRAALRSAHFSALLRMADGHWGRWRVGTLERMPWHKGPIGLIGDAAHAMLPFQAQGAAMGIEDAAVLAPLLASAGKAEEALARYAEIRARRIARVRVVSARNGFAFHLRMPFTLARDAAIAGGGGTGHLRRLAWLYGYDATRQEVRAVITR